MRQRVPRQPSTKWWFLVAALLATAITWWQSAGAPSRPGPRPDRAPPARAPGDLVWIEVEGSRDAGRP